MRGPVRGWLLGVDGLGDGVHWLAIRNIRWRGLAQSNYGLRYARRRVLYDNAFVLDRMDEAALNGYKLIPKRYLTIAR